jgi:Fe-Mn family superoxide dismutase
MIKRTRNSNYPRNTLANDWQYRLQSLLRRSLVIVGLCSLLVLAIFAYQPMAQTQAQASPETTTGMELSASPAELPPLPYAYDALKPYIDAETMELHHDRHHATYVENFNKALADYPDLQNQTVEAMLRDLDNVPEDIREKVRNNGGGHVNHTMFWEIMSPDGGGEPTGAIAEAINQSFGSFAQFQEEFEQAGKDRFGSGWVWLVRNDAKELEITTTPNQDTPIMDGQDPIMGNDVWEHAYYLNYRNNRGEYLSSWWNVVNWDEVNRRFEQAQS